MRIDDAVAGRVWRADREVEDVEVQGPRPVASAVRAVPQTTGCSIAGNAGEDAVGIAWIDPERPGFPGIDAFQGCDQRPPLSVVSQMPELVQA